jgi:Txe/YoeB family toxin of Txe-Axe toxin-antitoxin module
MGRLYNVKGWIEPADSDGDKLMQIIKAASAAPEYRGLVNNWTLTKAYGYSEFIFFGATAKHANSLVEDVINQIIGSQFQVDGYFECVDEEDEDNWSMRIVDSRAQKSVLPSAS